MRRWDLGKISDTTRAISQTFRSLKARNGSSDGRRGRRPGRMEFAIGRAVIDLSGSRGGGPACVFQLIIRPRTPNKWRWEVRVRMRGRRSA